MQIQEYLRQKSVPFRAISHRAESRAISVADALAVSARIMAKTVVLEADGEPVLAVLAASRRVDLKEVRELLGARDVRLASEGLCRILFPESELGALPPFGSMHGIRTIVDLSLSTAGEIVVEGNRRTEALRLAFSDYEELERPLVADIAKTFDA